MRAEFAFVVLHMAVVMALAIFGNLCLVFVIWKGNALAKQKISPVQLLLLHTCVADLLFAVLSLGTEILIINAYPFFYAPEFACKTVRYLQALPLYASPFLLVAISVDRYQAICRPLVHYRSDRYRRPNCLGFCAWVLAVLCSLPQIFIWHKPDKKISTAGGGVLSNNNYNNHNNNSTSYIYTTGILVEDECRTVYGRENSALKSAYVIWFDVVAWLLPSVISAVFYCKVCTTVWHSKCSLLIDSPSHGRTSQVHQLSQHGKPPQRHHRLMHKNNNNNDSNGSSITKHNVAAAATTTTTTMTTIATTSYQRDRTGGVLSKCKRLHCSTTNFFAPLHFTNMPYATVAAASSACSPVVISEFDRQRIQTVRLTLTIIACNFFLWAPFCVINIVQAFAPSLLSPKIITYIVILGNLNSCVNPWIYIFFNRRMAARAIVSLLPVCDNDGKTPQRSIVSPQHSSTWQSSSGRVINNHQNNGRDRPITDPLINKR